MNCRDLFARLSDVMDKAALIEAEAPDGACQYCSVSRYSPGRVVDDERVARLIFSPIHYDDVTDSPKEAAFQDARDKGMSVFRVRHTDERLLKERGERKAAVDRQRDPNRQYLGYIEAIAKDLRSIRIEGATAGCYVYDTAREDDAGHADVFVTKAPTKLERKQLIREIQKCFSCLSRPT